MATDLSQADPVIIALAIFAGIIPALLWLFFWLREDRINPEPRGLLFLTFLVGMASVIVVIPLEKLATHIWTNQNTLTVVWAATEELVKIIAVSVVALGSKEVNEPIDYVIYFITVGLGFAALENGLFLIRPVTTGALSISLLTGNLRFLGATLLHATSCSLVGTAMGLAFNNGWFGRKIYFIFGVLGAITLHSIFNLFIIDNTGQNFFKVFSFLWVIVVITILLFEKLRRMSQAIHPELEPKVYNNPYSVINNK